MIHLVKDPEQYAEAIRQEVPFYYAACGEIVSIRELTLKPGAVSCPMCNALIEAAMANQEPQPGPAVDGSESEPEPIRFEFDDDDAPGVELDLSDFGDDSDDSSEEDSGGMDQMLSMVQAMVGPYIEGVEVVENWEKWLEEPEDKDSIYASISEEERSLLSGLHGLASMIGLSDLTAAVVSILHRAAEGSSSDAG